MRKSSMGELCVFVFSAVQDLWKTQETVSLSYMANQNTIKRVARLQPTDELECRPFRGQVFYTLISFKLRKTSIRYKWWFNICCLNLFRFLGINICYTIYVETARKLIQHTNSSGRSRNTIKKEKKKEIQTMKNTKRKYISRSSHTVISWFFVRYAEEKKIPKKLKKTFFAAANGRNTIFLRRIILCM